MGGICKPGKLVHPVLARLLAANPGKSTMMLRFMSRPGMLSVGCPDTWGDGNKTPRGRSLVSRYPSHQDLMWHVRARDEHRCATCGAGGQTVIDHIISAGNGGAHHPENLQALCGGCNSAKTGWVDVPLARMLFPARTVV